MEGFKRFIGVVLIVIAAIVAIQTIIEPIYHTSTDDSPYSSAWDIINWLSAISIILGLIFGYIRLSGVGADSSVQEFIAANTLFYGFIFVAIIFFWNWFGIMEFASDFTAVSHGTRGLVWILFDAILPPLNIAMGIHLLRASE
ncbi:MAG: hypothetical protein OXU27_06990 [Candidatus Poribacteria bacterium]|nr:hypothetical protein [Candidatus Poribacteria bacterium]MDD9973731.1 hypothetical protein [Candidatus Poribacteria bacterium]